ncbi:MAG: TIGR01777 family oxidoreductase [Planctomycetota bacterium]|jgi:uncharacterized protein (TIGR01777 family)|nr:TIGR01777 family oxidoreductase [Planctomycetota bacterium]
MARYLCAGCTGLVGSRLLLRLRERGDDVLVLSRDPGSARRRLQLPPQWGCEPWDGCRDPIDPAWCRGRDAVINLSGAGIADKRWTRARKAELRDSRIISTQTLAAAAEAAGVSTLISASGVGIYPSGTTPCDENAAPDNGFLGQLCQDWEQASLGPQRRVNLRMGVVLSPQGGALAKLVPRFGPLAWLGSGRQAFAWIHIDDLVAMILAALDEPAWNGPVNAVAPAHDDLRTVISTAATCTRRWTMPFGVPGPVLALALGEMAGMLLTGAPVVPKRAQELGFRWDYPSLEPALAACLKPDGSTRPDD